MAIPSLPVTPRMIPRMRRALLILTCCAALAVSACSDATPEAEPIGLTTGTSEYGDILVNGDGLTLYFLLTDRQASSTCVDECESVWTPFQLDDLGTLGPNINVDFVGTITRDDDIVQVTYNGWPLYRYRDDGAPGDLNGHGALNAWFALGPNGGAVGITE